MPKHRSTPRIHVTPHPDGWQVKTERATKAATVTKTKAEAVEAGRIQAENQQTELVVHKLNGTIQNPNSHGNESRAKDSKP